MTRAYTFYNSISRKGKHSTVAENVFISRWTDFLWIKFQNGYNFFVAKKCFSFYKHAENEICFGLELYLDKEIQSDSAHSPQKALNELGLLGRKTERKAASTSLRVPCSNSGDSHLHPRPERPVYSGHRDVEARRLGLREQRRVGSL